jgi:hypothetical protein
VLQQEHSPAKKRIEAGAVRILPKQFFAAMALVKPTKWLFLESKQKVLDRRRQTKESTYCCLRTT